jgi:hypothetical protein
MRLVDVSIMPDRRKDDCDARHSGWKSSPVEVNFDVSGDVATASRSMKCSTRRARTLAPDG